MSSYLKGLPRLPMFDGDRFTVEWAGWFTNAQILLQDLGNSGTTTNRPTSNQYVGKPYFDTTLGLPIWMLTPGATPVWVNGAGSVV